MPNVTSKSLFHVRTRLLNMTWSNLRFNVWRSFVTKAKNLPSCFSIEFLEQLLTFLVNFTLLKYVKSQRSYGFLITKELILASKFWIKRSLLSLLERWRNIMLTPGTAWRILLSIPLALQKGEAWFVYDREKNSKVSWIYKLDFQPNLMAINDIWFQSCTNNISIPVLYVSKPAQSMS